MILVESKRCPKLTCILYTYLSDKNIPFFWQQKFIMLSLVTTINKINHFKNCKLFGSLGQKNRQGGLTAPSTPRPMMSNQVLVRGLNAR